MSLKIPSKKNKVGDCVPEPRASSLSKRREKNLKPRTFFRRKTRARKSSSRPNDNIFGNTIRRHGTVLHWLSTGIQSISKSTGFSCCQRSTRVEEIHIEPRPLQKPKRPTNLFPTAASRENFSLCPTDLSQNQVPPHAVEERKDFGADRKKYEDQETPRTGDKELEEQKNPCIDNKRQREEQSPDVEDKRREEHNSNHDNKKQGEEQSRSHENTNKEEEQVLCFQNKNKLQEEDPCNDEDEVFDIDSEYSDGNTVC